jgi:uncharacterized protein YecE (DUF72 family)
MALFHDAITPMKTKLGAVLFQLPPTFKKDAALLADFLDEMPTGLRAAFEFRHASWLTDDILEVLRAHHAALCVAEGEGVVSPTVATADFGYLRLRREDYTAADIANWAKFIRQQAPQWKEAFVYFKHEETGVGPKFAEQLRQRIET